MAIELEHSNFDFRPNRDERQRMEEPLPVEIEAVADVHLPCARVDTAKLDALYVTILEFAPIHQDHHPAYQADNFRLLFDLPRRELIQEDFRTTKIIVQSPSPELKAGLAKIGDTITAEWVATAGADGKAILDAFKK